MSPFPPASAAPSVGQLLILQQSQQIASLTEQCRSLAALVANSQGSSKPPAPPTDPEQLRMRGLSLRDFCRTYYWPEKHHAPDGPTAELTAETLNRLRDCYGREMLVHLLKGSVNQFAGIGLIHGIGD